MDGDMHASGRLARAPAAAAAAAAGQRQRQRQPADDSCLHNRLGNTRLGCREGGIGRWLSGSAQCGRALPWRLAAASRVAPRAPHIPSGVCGACTRNSTPISHSLGAFNSPQAPARPHLAPGSQSTAAAESQRRHISRCGAAWEADLHCRNPQASVKSLPWLRRWTRGTSTSRRGWVCFWRSCTSPAPAHPHAQSMRTPCQLPAAVGRDLCRRHARGRRGGSGVSAPA
jgi:hypothetical protein